MPILFSYSCIRQSQDDIKTLNYNDIWFSDNQLCDTTVDTVTIVTMQCDVNDQFV